MKDRFETLERLFRNRKDAVSEWQCKFNLSSDQLGAQETLKMYYDELIDAKIKRLAKGDDNGKDIDC